jgi:hypothetical protein
MNLVSRPWQIHGSSLDELLTRDFSKVLAFYFEKRFANAETGFKDKQSIQVPLHISLKVEADASCMASTMRHGTQNLQVRRPVKYADMRSMIRFFCLL